MVERGSKYEIDVLDKLDILVAYLKDCNVVLCLLMKVNRGTLVFEKLCFLEVLYKQRKTSYLGTKYKRTKINTLVPNIAA